MSCEIQERANFDFIRYANCWEDPELLLGAFDLKGKRALSIASAGDNSFSLLTANPKRVVAFDLNLTQLHLVELKKCAFETLEHPEFLAFLGFTNAESRLDLYRQQVRPHLSEKAAVYFDSHPDWLTQGIIHKGKFEHYFQLFCHFLLPLIHSSKTIRELLAEKDEKERTDFYHRKWNTWRFRLLFRLFFNRATMGKLGRDPEFFRYATGKTLTADLIKRCEDALTRLPTATNPYLHYIITGSFGDALPHYARREHFDAIRNNLHHLTLLHGTLEQAEGPFHAFNLSDIFEYMAPDLTQATARQILTRAAAGARVAYYNMMVPRSLSASLPGSFTPLTDLSQTLFARNQAFFYAAFFVDEIPEGSSCSAN